LKHGRHTAEAVAGRRKIRGLVRTPFVVLRLPDALEVAKVAESKKPAPSIAPEAM
jgi:hypothetical protein